MSKRLHNRLAFRVLTPIIVFALAFGAAAIGFGRLAVTEFVERQVTSDLRWRSQSVFHIIDSNLDELQRTGRTGEDVAVRHRKVNALLEIEDFARANELKVHVYDNAEQRAIDIGVEPRTDGASGWLGDWFAGELRQYTHAFAFEPWRWDVTLTQDNRAYLTLLNVLLWGAGVAVVVFVAGIAGFMFYLTALTGRPIRRIIHDLEQDRPPKYRGIAEFEYLGQSIATMMGAIREQAQLLQATFAHIGEGLCVFDQELNCLTWNAKFLELYGLEAMANVEPTLVSAALARALDAPAHQLGERLRGGATLEHVRPGGRTIEIRIEPMGAGRFVSTHEDITERKAAEERIRHLATHDVLTGQPNRFLFQDRLHQAIVAARRSGQRGGVLFIDLDRFKDVNDTLGHEVGDQLLKEIAQRIDGTLRESDTASRFGGDEFAVMIPVVEESHELAHIAEKLIEQLAAPFTCRGNAIQTGASIGITIFPDDGADVIRLLRNADIALYEAKGAGRGQYRFFTERLNARVQERANLMRDLRRALDKNEFILRYQPQVDLVTRKVVGVEALIRWHHPQRGTLAPQSFIPLAEQSGQIVAIGEWALRQACAQGAEWHRHGVALRVSVNVSAVQIRRGDVVQTVERALAEYALPPEFLELEITESTFLEDPETAIGVFGRLREMGVRISLDDFGTGYSSMSYLRRLPLSEIKIDHSFIHDMNARPADATIVRGIIGLAHGLGPIRVVAEGVENWKQFDTLCEMKCDEGQGFLLCGPVSAAEVAGLPQRLCVNGEGGTSFRLEY